MAHRAGQGINRLVTSFAFSVPVRSRLQAVILFCPSEPALVDLSFILCIASSNIFIPHETLVVLAPFLRTVFIECSYLILGIYFLAILSIPHRRPLPQPTTLHLSNPPLPKLPHSVPTSHSLISSLMLSLVLLVQLFILLSSVEHCFMLIYVVYIPCPLLLVILRIDFRVSSQFVSRFCDRETDSDSEL